MNVVHEFDDAANSLERLLAALSPANMQDKPLAITPEWMQQAREIMDQAGTLMNPRPSSALKPTPEAQRYQQSLLRLKNAVEHGQRELMAQRSLIHTERTRLNRVRALTNTLDALQ